GRPTARERSSGASGPLEGERGRCAHPVTPRSRGPPRPIERSVRAAGSVSAMTESAAPESAPIDVHALLVCREVQTSKSGGVTGAGFKTWKVQAGGWFGVEFRVGESVLARTRFAIGVMQIAKPAAEASAPS